jgi:hypothetical protein
MWLPPLIKQANDKLTGVPDQVLTYILISIAVILILVAIKAPPAMKALVAAWALMP